MKKTFQTYLRRWPYFLTMLGLWFMFHLNLELKTLVVGILASLGMTIFTSSVVYDERGFKFQGLSIWLLIKYFFVLIREIFKSAWSYIWTIFSGRHEVVVFDLALEFHDPIKVAFVANSITLTPGTVSVDVNDNTITVMALVKKGTPQIDIETPIRRRFETLLKEKK
jgi:multicomponent Na+:H+ antiporter subunit E